MLQPKIGDPVIHFYLKDDAIYLDEFSFAFKGYCY